MNAKKAKKLRALAKQVGAQKNLQAEGYQQNGKGTIIADIKTVDGVYKSLKKLHG